METSFDQLAPIALIILLGALNYLFAMWFANWSYAKRKKD